MCIRDSPSGAIGWVPTNYDFMRKAVPWLDFLKIRFSDGQVGNDRISNKRFPYLTIINSNAATCWGSDSNGVNLSLIHISDHHAIIPTGVYAQNLTDMERRVYDLIARRFIAVFYPCLLYTSCLVTIV